MNPNQLKEYIRKLNEEQAVIHEQKRIAALNKIKQLREKQKNDQRDFEQRRNVIPQ